jgi:hypothetical protein
VLAAPTSGEKSLQPIVKVLLSLHFVVGGLVPLHIDSIEWTAHTDISSRAVFLTGLSQLSVVFITDRLLPNP